VGCVACARVVQHGACTTVGAGTPHAHHQQAGGTVQGAHADARACTAAVVALKLLVKASRLPHLALMASRSSPLQGAASCVCACVRACVCVWGGGACVRPQAGQRHARRGVCARSACVPEQAPMRARPGRCQQGLRATPHPQRHTPSLAPGWSRRCRG
jgi:hypothetical protein